jgi:hypothetical protein
MSSAGSLIADFLNRKDLSIERDQIVAAVRSEEQANLLSNLGIGVLRVDLANEAEVVEGVLRHNGRYFYLHWERMRY